MDETRTLTAIEGESDGLEPATVPYLVIALDCARPCAPPARIHLDTTSVSIGRGACRRWTRETSDGGARVLRVELPDAWMSSAHAQLVADRAGRWTLVDQGSKNGTFVGGVRVERKELLDGDVIEVGNTILVHRVATVNVPRGRQGHLGRPLDATLSERPTRGLPRTLNPVWSEALTTALRVAQSDVSILVTGESGTGKEVLARAVHTASGRSGAFVALNCGAIPRTLIEAELFGVRKGAYSGATEDRPGLVRAADRGTLFLDEIAELPESSQVALLRVLQQKEVLPVGDTRVVSVDVRVIAATHADLAARVAEGRFRADLYARLCGHVVRVPSLRERIEDVGLLVGELLPLVAEERAERLVLSRAAGRALFLHDWPFNVRELEHALRAALAIAEDDEIRLAHLPEVLRGEKRTTGAAAERAAGTAEQAAAAADEPESVRAERERIVAALEACNGNQTKAARMLGISRATLVTKLSIHRLPRPRKSNR